MEDRARKGASIAGANVVEPAWRAMAVFMAAVSLVSSAVLPAHAESIRPGLALGASYIQDYFRDVSGGLRRGGGAPGRIDLSATVDGRLWHGSPANVFYVDLLGTTGSSISGQVGDLQGLDNVEAHNTLKLFGAWYQHTFSLHHVRLRIGVQDYNAWFDVLDAAGVFVNSSFGLDPTISQLPVSTFPTTTLGAALRWQSVDGMYVMGGVYDGRPGLAGHPDGTHIALRDGDGVFTAIETGVVSSGAESFKLALGGWYRSTAYRDPAGRPRHNNNGAYAIGQYRITPQGQEPAVHVFLQIGATDGQRNQLDRYIGAGFTASGLVPHRPHDTLGVGMARAHTGSAYRRNTPDATTAETALELTYQAHYYGDTLTVQPDVQYIIDPGADGRVASAWVVGVRGQYRW